MTATERIDAPQIQRNISRDIKYTLALILAGGRGTRLRDLTKWRVKPAVPFGGKFRIIDFALSNCINSGVRQIGVITQYKAQSLIRHIVRGWNFLHTEMDEFIEILPAQQRVGEGWYAGTADAVYQNIDFIRFYNPDYVLVLAGDHIYKMDYGPMIAFHRSCDAEVTVGCIEIPVEEGSRYGVMKVNEAGQIQEFAEKPAEPSMIPGKPGKCLASMGIYVFNSSLLFEHLIEDADDTHSSHDFGGNIIPRLVGNQTVYAYPFQDADSNQAAYWRDVGTVDSYWEANLELIGVTPPLNLYDERWPIRSTLQQYPPAKFVFNDEGRRGMAVDSMISVGCIVSGGYVESSLLFRNVRVNDYSRVTESVILPDTVVGEKCTINRAIIDKGCEIASGTEIGVDPVRDKERFYVSPNGVVLVTPEMLGQSLHRVR